MFMALDTFIDTFIDTEQTTERTRVLPPQNLRN